jgi:hypothetical protein
MRRILIVLSTMLLLTGLLFTARASALDAVGRLKSVDLEKGFVTVFANGQDRKLTIDAHLKVLDAEGKEMAVGLKSPEFKEGAQVTVSVERGPGSPSLKTIRLGAVGGRGEPNSAGRRRPEGGEGKTSVGFKPLTEMSASDKYKGEDGGLYGGGKNDPPAAHLAAAKRETAKIAPLDREGKPSPDGTIGLISISMSNATQEFSMFKRIADGDAGKSPLVTVVDCAQGGQAMAQWSRPDARPWGVAEQRLSAAGISPRQVQVAWIKLANVAPEGELWDHGQKLYDDTLAVLEIAKSKFPNLRIAYLGSRIYAGYAGSRLNPEPYAYEGAFVVRKLILDQAKGEASLNFDPSHGEVKAPLLLWGPYFWADGMTARKCDGLVWERGDLGPDGTHPSESGRRKVADMLLTFFKTDADANTWFVGK